MFNCEWNNLEYYNISDNIWTCNGEHTIINSWQCYGEHEVGLDLGLSMC